VKVAVVHDWLVTYAGAERVLEQVLSCYPSADIFCVVDFISYSERKFLLNKSTHPSFIQKLPFARTHYRRYLPLMPKAVGRFDLSDYDLIVSSSHAVAKGVGSGPGQLHISYVHSPMRYAWDLREQYLKESNLDNGLKGSLAHWILDRLRDWDARTAEGVDHFIANSHFIAQRIEDNYNREAEVIYPPVDVEQFAVIREKEDFYVTASRMVPYKKMDLIVEAFRELPARKLVVIGDGPDFKKIKSKAGSNVSFLGHQSSEVLRDYLQRARAFVFAAEEDFGITVVEAQACGTPVIAYGKGGALETVRGLGGEGPTGMFFDRQDVASLTEAIGIFEQNRHAFSPEACRQNALRFNAGRFREEFSSFVEQKWDSFQRNSVKTN
jgi:glycosyltransferase involved in cell wall biosynthesis